MRWKGALYFCNFAVAPIESEIPCSLLPTFSRKMAPSAFSSRPHGSTLLLFDVDGTLSPARQVRPSSSNSLNSHSTHAFSRADRVRGDAELTQASTRAGRHRFRRWIGFTQDYRTISHSRSTQCVPSTPHRTPTDWPRSYGRFRLLFR